MPELLTETGEFTDEFRAALPRMLDMESLTKPDGSTIKVFDDIPNISSLVKTTYDTKTALGKKLDNVIQKPGEGASDQEKAAYKAAIATAAGAPEAAADYEFFKSEKLPEGMERSQELEDRFRALFFEHKAPKELVKALSQVFEEMQIAGFNAATEGDKTEAAKAADEAQRVFDEDCAKLKTENPGDKLAEFTRISLVAINKFADPELVEKLKTANMYENAADLAKWREVGVPLSTLRLFNRIALQTLDAKLLGGGTVSGGKPTEDEKLRKMYPNTKD